MQVARITVPRTVGVVARTLMVCMIALSAIATPVLSGWIQTTAAASVAQAAQTNAAAPAKPANPAAPAAPNKVTSTGVSYTGWNTGTLTDANIYSLIASMVLTEETTLVHGSTEPSAECSTYVIGCVGQAGYVFGVARLGIPPRRETDGPAGIRLSYPTTALPAPVGMTASFDRSAASLYGVILGSEGRAANQDVLYAPMVNQVIFPTGGRNFETLGEDPYLAGELVTAETRGVQSQGLIATIKHYVMNDFENARTSASVTIDERTLHEQELQAFEKVIQQANPGAIMCSYNRINDLYGCSNDLTMTTLARGLFGYKGWFLSDYGATHRTADMMAGLDSQMGSATVAGFADATLVTAVTTGTAAIALTNDLPAVPAYSGAQWKAALDLAVFHILSGMNEAGLLEGTIYGSRAATSCAAGPALPCTPYVPTRPLLANLIPGDVVSAQTIAEESATLLKNNNSLLPLTSTDLTGTGTLFMGPTSVTPYIGGGGSANVTPLNNAPDPYSSLIAAAGGSPAVSYVPGYDLDGQLLPPTAITATVGTTFAGQSGWARTQISTTVPASGVAPAACVGTCAADQLDATVDYTNTNTLPANTAWRWQGTVTIPYTGSWQLKVFVKNQNSASLFVDGLATAQRRVNMGAYAVVSGGIGGSTFASYDKLAQTAKTHNPAVGKLQQAAYTVTFNSVNEQHTLDLRAYANATDPMNVRFVWVPSDWQTTKIAEAAAAAASVNKVVIFAYDEGTEGSDRGGSDQNAGLALPGYQNALIAAVAAVNPNTVVVLNTGDPVYMPWASSVKSILEMWYPGQMGGAATARVLLGQVNPSGKLPVTFPDGSAASPRFPTDDANCVPSGPTNCPLYPGVNQPGFISGNHSYRSLDETTNSIFTGYRWYDKNSKTPLFPFGQGLSYTQFQYTDLNIQAAGDGFDVNFNLTNSGAVSGTEVVQAYSGAVTGAPVPMAVKALADFKRITLASGQTQNVTLHVGARQMSYWDVTTHAWVAPSGARKIYVGSSSRDIRLQRSVTPSNIPTQAVTWVDQIGVSASGASITKSSASNGWNAGAVSSMQIASGDGYVQTTISDTTGYSMVGLSNGDTNADYADIDYAIYTYANTGQLAVYENGVYRGNFDNYALGDTLKVAVESGVVKYYHNGFAFYSSSVAPSYPLLLDTSIFTPGGQVGNAIIGGSNLSAVTPWTPTPSPTPTNTPVPLTCGAVVYLNALRVNVSGNTITKNSATSAWNAGATSNKTLNSGDGYVSSTINSTATYTMVGLGADDNQGGYAAINFAIYTYANTGQLAIYESGAFRGLAGAYTVGDVIKVAVEGGLVKYYKNATLLYTSGVTPSLPLLLNAAIFTPGAAVSNAQICGQDLGTPVAPAKVGNSQVPANKMPQAPTSAGPAPAQPAVPSGAGSVNHNPAGASVIPDRPIMPTVSFSDVPANHWAAQYINWAVAHLALSGYSGANGREFRANQSATRGQVVKLLVGAAGYELVSSGSHFSDVATSSPFYRYIETAAAHNLVSGFADGTFRPNNTVTRAQMAKLVVIAAGWQQSQPGQATFSDVPTNDWAAGYIAAVAQHGVASGYADGTFHPAAQITRAQLAKMLYNAFAGR